MITLTLVLRHLSENRSNILIILVGSKAVTPNKLQAVLVLSDTILLSWSFINNPPNNVFYLGFKVLYQPAGGTTRVIIVHGNNKRSCFLYELRPNTLYHAEVKAFSDHGDGLASLPVTVKTLDSGTYILEGFPAALGGD